MSAIALLTRGYVDRLRKVIQQVPLNPTEGQALLVKSLELPLPTAMTEALGIHQSDIIIRSALVAAFADLRANPYLLDYVFASLPPDALTWREYGDKSVQAARDWFLRTQIDVKMEPVLNEFRVPVITVQLLDSSEAVGETTLGDIHYTPQEGIDSQWPSLTGVLTPKSYVPATGIITLAAELPEGVGIGPGMFIVDSVGRPHEILEVYDSLSFRIGSGTVADFRGSVLKPHRPAYRAHLESSSYRETYRIGVHVGGEPAMLTWLHSIVVFCLLRYKQALLEARGFERSTMTSSDFAREQSMDTELVFSRYITVSGYVRQYWPKLIAPVIDVLETSPLRVSGVDTVEDVGLDPRNQLWTGENDE